MPMELLFLSCHEVLEFDEIRMFHKMGIHVFSPGAYVEPENPGGGGMRPSVPGLVYDPETLEHYHRLGKDLTPGTDTKEHLTKEFVDRFDAVVIMHLPKWLEKNWEVMKHKRVIMRTIGQNITNNEEILNKYVPQGLKIVRYSPQERTIPGYAGENAMIRFAKRPEEYGPWSGEAKQVVTFCQSMPKRGQHCGWSTWQAVTRNHPRKLFGPGNEQAGPANGGKVSFDELRRQMRINRAYFYTGTTPASYTLNFMEAWLSGIPIVAMGPQLGNAKYLPGAGDLYEIHKLIKNGETGFWSDDVQELQAMIGRLFKHDALAAEIGAAGRRAAIEHFSEAVIAPQWQSFLGSL